jgi:hypothetical protein
MSSIIWLVVSTHLKKMFVSWNQHPISQLEHRNSLTPKK